MQPFFFSGFSLGRRGPRIAPVIKIPSSTAAPTPAFDTLAFTASSIIILLLVLTTIPTSSYAAPAKTQEADPLTPIDAGSMDAIVLITNTVKFSPAGSRYSMTDATGTLTWFPRQYALQALKEIRFDPAPATQSDNTVTFRWSPPQEIENVLVQSTVHTRNAIIPVRERVPFPIQEVPSEIAQYLEPREMTDQTPEIQQLAQQLSAGKTDSYEVVYSLADWTTRNVNYSLASLGQPAIQKASQVLKSREGKCDELTALFISMNRAIGIPARFVAGYSYTNSERFTKTWGGHGWAEVWLPDQGWIPFDVTYGEYGYLDAGHITLKYAPDAKETSIDYSARGREFDLHTEPLDITITPTKLEPRQTSDLSISLDAPQKEVGFGSAVLILAKVTNNRDYYVSTRIDLGKTSNTDLLSQNYQNILLKPKETKTIPFLAKVDSGLRPGYTYEFPFSAYTRLGERASIIIKVDEYATVYDESAYNDMNTQLSGETTKPVSFSITCDQATVTYVGKPATHTCTIINRPVFPIKICQQASCADPVPIDTGSDSFAITTTDAKPGAFTHTYTASTRDESSRFFIKSKSVLPTTLNSTLRAPAFATPNDLVATKLFLDHNGAMPKNVVINMHVQRAKATQQLDDLSRPAELSFTTPGRALRPGENTIIADISFKDELGTPYTQRATSTITLTNVNLMDQIEFWFTDAGNWVGDLFS